MTKITFAGPQNSTVVEAITDTQGAIQDAIDSGAISPTNIPETIVVITDWDYFQANYP